MPLVAIFKPANVVGWALKNACRVKLSESKQWNQIDGAWKAWQDGSKSGSWIYDKGELRLRGTSDDVVLRNVHWDFQRICPIRDLTGKGIIPTRQIEITWVMGKGDTGRNLTMPPPKVVLQGQQTICWAASLESWLGSTLGRAKLTTSELLRKYQGQTNAAGELTGTGWRHVMADQQIDMRWRPGDDESFLAAEAIYDKLRTKQYLYVPYQTYEHFDVHVVVLYGIRTRSDGVDEVQVMDPMRGLTTISLAELKAKAKVGLGTKQ